jgi:hypothetical protein
MTPLRLHLHTYVGTVLCIFGCLAVSFLGMFMLSAAPAAPQVIQEAIEDGTWGGLFGIMFYAIFSLGFTFGGLIRAYEWLVEEPLWIEIGPRFTYCTLTGVNTHEWTDIESIQIKHTVREESDEDDTSYSLSTSLVVTLVNEKQIDLGAESYDKRDMIFRTLVEGLSDGESGTRRFSAEALGRFRADALPDLQVEMKRMCESQREDFKEEAAAAECRAEAFEVLLSGIVPHLREAMQNTDGDVPRAAGATLHRWGSQPLSPLPTVIATNARRKR